MNSQENFDGEWLGTLTLSLEATKMLYDHFDYSIKMWPGSPARPAEEQEFLLKLKHQMFAMILEHNFHTNESTDNK